MSTDPGVAEIGCAIFGQISTKCAFLDFFASADGLLTWDLRPLTYGTPRVVADMISRLNRTAWALQKPNLSKSAIFHDGVLEPEVVFPRHFSRRNRVFSIVSGCGEP